MRASCALWNLCSRGSPAVGLLGYSRIFFVTSTSVRTLSTVVEQSSNPTRNETNWDSRQIAASIRKATRTNSIDTVMEMLTTALNTSRADQYVIEAALAACFSLNQADRVPDILAKLKEFEIELSEAMMSALISGYCKTQQPENAFESFEVAQEMGMAISHKENVLVESLIEHNMTQQLYVVLKAMQDTKEKYKYPNDVTWSTISKAATARGDFNLPLELFKKYDGDATHLNSNFWKNLLVGYLQKGETDKGVAIWDLCKQYTKIDSLPYSMAITSFARVHQYTQVISLYEEMIGAGQVPDDVVYIPVLQALTKLNQLDRAKEVVDTMKKQGITPSQTAYMLVLEGFVRANDFHKALGLLEDMKEVGVKPTNAMWSIIIHGLGKATQLDRALSVISKLSENHPMEFVSYKSVLTSLVQARLGEYSAQQLEELRQLGINYDDNLKSAVLHTVNDALDGVKGNFNTILDEMDAAGLKPDEIMFNILLDGCVRKKRMDQARAAIHRMQTQYNITPSHITWGTFLKGLGLAGQVDEAVALFEDKMPPSTRSQYDYNTMIHQMIRNKRLDLALKYFDEMNTSGVEPTEITANILMAGFGKARDLEQCFTVFNAFKSKIGKLSSIAYNILMSCCIQNKRPDRAVQLMEEMQHAGVQPISFLGWDKAAEGINRINKLEQSFAKVQNGKTGATTFCDLMKVCVECGRKDLVVAVTEKMQQENISWEAVQQQLQKDDPILLEKVQLWLQEAGEAPLDEDQLKKLDNLQT